MAGKFSEPQYRPQQRQSPSVVDWNVENDMDYTTPYPCGVCRRTFTSRYELATHKHPRKGAA